MIGTKPTMVEIERFQDRDYIILYNITDNGTNVYLRLNHEYLKKLSF